MGLCREVNDNGTFLQPLLLSVELSILSGLDLIVEEFIEPSLMVSA